MLLDDLPTGGDHHADAPRIGTPDRLCKVEYMTSDSGLTDAA